MSLKETACGKTKISVSLSHTLSMSSSLLAQHFFERFLEVGTFWAHIYLANDAPLSTWQSLPFAFLIASWPSVVMANLISRNRNKYRIFSKMRNGEGKNSSEKLDENWALSCCLPPLSKRKKVHEGEKRIRVCYQRYVRSTRRMSFQIS